MPPKPLKGKSISSFFVKAPSFQRSSNVERSTSPTESEWTEQRTSELTSRSSSSSSSSSTTRAKRPLVAPEFGTEAIQHKKSTKIGNIVLTSIESTTVPVLSIRARDRASKTLSSARARKASNRSHTAHVTDDYGTADEERADEIADIQDRHVEGESETIETVPAVREESKAIVKKVSPSWSTTEVGLRVAESNSFKGDKSLEMRPGGPDGGYCLFCLVCDVNVHPNKKNTTTHLKTATHLRGALVKKAQLESTNVMANALQQWRKNSPNSEGATLGEQTDLFRLETVSVFMQCGLPLSKIDGLRDYLQKYAKMQLTDQSHMRPYVTLVREIERNRVKQSLKKAKYFSVIFDGSSRVDEVLAVILRYVTTGNSIIRVYCIIQLTNIKMYLIIRH